MKFLKEPIFQKIGAAFQGETSGKITMSPREYVARVVGDVTAADLRKKVREDAQKFPIWAHLAQKVQQGSGDAELMARLSY